MPRTALEPYYVPMFQIMFTRLSSSKTEVFALRFVRFYHFMSARDENGLGADFVINVAEQVQTGYGAPWINWCNSADHPPSVFTQLYLSIILPDTQKLARPLDRKTAVISLTKTLTDSAAFVDKYKKGWTFTCEALLKLLENPPLPLTTDDTIPDQDVDDLSFGVGFTQLNTCKKVPKDPWPEISDVKSWVGQYLKAADQKHNGRVSCRNLSSSAKNGADERDATDQQYCTGATFARNEARFGILHAAQIVGGTRVYLASVVYLPYFCTKSWC